MVEAEVTIRMSEKGQVVIPQVLRKELELTSKTKLVVYRKDNLLIMEKRENSDLEKEWEEIFEMMDKKGLNLTEEEIQQEIDAARAENSNR